MYKTTDKIFFFKLKKDIKDNLILKKKLIKLKKKIGKAIKIIYFAISNKKKIFICGNGGSAGDAQHLASEFLVRIRPQINRKPIPIINLALDNATFTASANDYGYHQVFSKNLDAIGDYGDVLISLSTSGNSKNIIEVIKKANQKNIYTISLLGAGGGKSKKISKLSLIIPSRITARIQEAHIFLGHHILECVEDLLLKFKKI